MAPVASAVAFVVVVALSLLLCREAAASPSAKLVYVRGAGADSCPGETELRKAVALRLGYDPFFPVAQKTVVAQVTRVRSPERGFRGRVQIVGDDGNVRGERELSTKGDDCTELVGALALAVSIALDDLDEVVTPPPPPPPQPPAAKVEEPQPQPAPPPAKPATPDRPQPSPPPPTAPPKAPTQLTLSLGPTVSLGTAPDAAAGASLAIALRFPGIASIRIDARGELPSSKTLPQGGRVATNVLVGTASFCLRGRVPFACVGFGGGALFSSTEGITRPATDRASLLVGLARAGADIALSSRLYLEPFAELGANLLARSVQVDGRAVYETSPVWGIAGIHFGGHLL
jgi:hypothetical protein